MQCSMGLEGAVPPLDDIGVVWKDFVACCKTVGSAERRKSVQKISTRPLGQIFMDVGITENKLSRRYRGKSDLYYG